MTIPVSWIISILTFIFGLAVWLGKLSFERTLNKWDQKREKEERIKEEVGKQKEKERQEEIEMVMRGLKIITDSMYEVVYQMETGKHNGGLDQCLKDIIAYRKDVNEWIIGKASHNQK